MSEIPPKELKKYIDEKRTETKDGSRLLYSPSGKEVGKVARTLTSQLDYTRAILRQIENCQFAGLYGENAFARSIIILINMIPDDDTDDQFKEDVENAKGVKSIRTGHWKGRKEVVKQVETFNFHALFKACINLFRRRGLLWGESQTEVFW